MSKDKSQMEYGNYTIVKNQDGDVVLVGKEGAITEEYKTKKEIKRYQSKNFYIR